MGNLDHSFLWVRPSREAISNEGFNPGADPGGGHGGQLPPPQQVEYDVMRISLSAAAVFLSC